jgi:hypothetical protein
MKNKLIVNKKVISAITAAAVVATSVPIALVVSSCSKKDLESNVT